MAFLVRIKRRENNPGRRPPMYCVHCGAENPADATFCQKCGKRLPTTDQDDSTILSFPSALSSPYGQTPYTSTPSIASDPVFAPPSPSGVRSSGEIASSSGIPSASLVQRPKKRRGYILVLVLMVLLVSTAVGAYFYLNRSTPDKTLTTYYGHWSNSACLYCIDR
jgi:hypothetical protein